MTAYHSPAQLFAQLQQQYTSPPQTVELQDRSPSNHQQQQQRRLLVFRETGYAFSTPDRIKCVLLCSSTKVCFTLFIFWVLVVKLLDLSLKGQNMFLKIT